MNAHIFDVQALLLIKTVTLFNVRTQAQVFVYLLSAGEGITSVRRVTEYAAQCGVKYVNHAFTSHLALSVSLQPYVGYEDSRLCEFPQEVDSLAYDLTSEHLLLNPNGEIQLPEKPGLGLEPDRAALQKYLVDTSISVNGRVLYQTPEL